MQNAVNHLVGLIANSGLKHVVLCPGSRNAQLILAFSRNPKFTCFSLIDERSACYTAMGMAMQSREPVLLVCTSGTAVLNLYPAICEAFYAQIPLVILTADRPKELIDQWDGQSIRQNNIFEKHILGFATFDPYNPDYSVMDLVNLSNYPVKGPVHINIPMSEPLYKDKSMSFTYPTEVFRVKTIQVPKNLPTQISYGKVLVFMGADWHGQKFIDALKVLSLSSNIVFLADLMSQNQKYQTVDSWDVLLNQAGDAQKKSLQPELLISFGKYTVSKGLKNFLKEYKCLEHWHVTSNHTIADPFKTNPKEVYCDEIVFIEWLLSQSESYSSEFKKQWQVLESKYYLAFDNLFTEKTFNEFSIIRKILKHLPSGNILHSGNSMPVRYLSFLSKETKHLEVYGNRGTSGIDGCVSTAAGASMLADKNVYLIIGDLSFFYDVNGLWNQYLKANFNIIILNNNGGDIFRLIDGPSDLPELEMFFAGSAKKEKMRHAKNIAEDFDFNYCSAKDYEGLATCLNSMNQSNERGTILELFIDSAKNREFFQKFKNINVS